MAVRAGASAMKARRLLAVVLGAESVACLLVVLTACLFCVALKASKKQDSSQQVGFYNSIFKSS